MTMTREEAIAILSEKIKPCVLDEWGVAIDMAIEALQFAEHFDLLKEYQSLQEVVRCKDCKYRPHLENENGSDYGFNVSGDETCPCVNNDDGWYSWMPKDNFYCGFGERKGGDDE